MNARPLIGVRGGVAAAATLAVLLSASLRRTAALAAADAWSLLAPPRLEAATDDVTTARQLRVECLRLRRLTAAPRIGEPPRFRSNAVGATVLWTTPGGRESVLSLVGVESDGPVVVDAGDADAVTADDLVLLGNAVAGRVTDCGRRSSSVVTVRSPDFAVAAGLVRDAAGGPVEGASGVYVGGVDAGRLTGVPAERAVRVGDFVYTREESSWSADRLAIGVVTAAELPAAASEWSITVRPYADLRRHDQVRVLRATADP